MPTNLRPNPLVELSRLFTNAWKSFWAKRAAVNELADCGSVEVARIAQDLGISTADLCVVATRDKTAADCSIGDLSRCGLTRPASILQLCVTFNAAVRTATANNYACMSSRTSQKSQAGRNTVRTMIRLLPLRPNRYRLSNLQALSPLIV